MRRKATFEAQLPQSPSKTVPGQSLKPAEVIERHLAGTLPDIAKEPMFTHDEEGNQISEDLSKLELHELFDLGKQLRAEYDKRAAQLDESEKAAEKERIRKEYELELAAAKVPAEPPRAAGA